MSTSPSNPRNTYSPPSDNWLFLTVSGDIPTAICSIAGFAFGQALVGGGTGLSVTVQNFGAGPTYGLATAICPAVLYVGSPYYKSLQKFVQLKFNSGSFAQFGIGIMNFIDTSGNGVAGASNITHDAYVVDLVTGANPLRLQRFNSGALPTSLQNAVLTLAQGDVVRASFDFTNPAQVTITVLKNSVQQYQIVDNAVSRLPSSGLSFPVIVNYAGTSGASALASNFSAGIGL